MTFPKIIVVLLTFSLLIPTLVQPTTVYSQPQDRVQSTRQATGRTTNTYREVQSADAQAAPQSRQRPAWVENALERSFAFLNARDKSTQTQVERVRPAAQERFTLHHAEQDDLGLTHVRLNQVHRGVPVFGRQIITHLDANGIRSTSGATLDSVDEIEAHPIISAEYAVNVAKAKLGYGGNFAREPEVKLVVLPHEFFHETDKTGATLTYQVELQILDGTAATGHHRYFVDAATREIVWYYNALPNDTGRSLYRGTVNIAGQAVPKVQGYPAQISYENSLIDTSRGGLRVFDMTHSSSMDTLFQHVGTDSAIYSWGDGTKAHPETVAVDAYWGAARAWDYFLERYQRNGADGAGGQISLGVHYGGLFGSSYNNAHATANTLLFGDGDGVTYNPFVSLDVVGHEFTHLVIDKTAGFILEEESGSLSESFADIFGTAIEFYASNNGNYLMAEQVTKNGKGGRSLSDPASFGDPDHYSKRVKSSDCGYGGCDLHPNAGIPNKAFYLLAEGGNAQGTALTGIGRIKAEKIFYRALTTYLFPNAQFADARRATLKAAADIYGQSSVEQKAVATAWSLVGISCAVDLVKDSMSIPQQGGTFSVAVTADGNCTWNAVSDVPWIKVTSGGSGTTNGTVIIAVEVNLGEARNGTITISGRTLTIAQEAMACELLTINSGQTVTRQLSTGSCYMSVQSTTRRGERFSFSGQAGKPVAFAMNSTTLDSYLRLIGPDGTVIATSDDIAGGTNARLPETGYITLPATGTYIVEATTSPKSSLQIGSYTLTYLVGCQFQLTAPTLTWGKAGGTSSFLVTVSGGCAVTAVSNAPQWLEITGQTVVMPGVVKVSYKVQANNTATSRTGTITVGNQTLMVTQAGT